MSCGTAIYPYPKQAWTPLPRYPESAAAAALPSLRYSIVALVRMHERWCQRQALLDLDDRLLRDIGITRQQAEQEAAKSLWR
jgi:uncharacterized protein YjiS (DUF1127 family)